MKIVRQSILLLALVALVSSVARAEVVVLQASKDNTLFEPGPLTGNRSNGKGIFFFAGSTGQGAFSSRRGLIAFDLAQIPPGSVINSAVLKLSHFHPSQGPLLPFNVSLHRLSKDWGEGTSDAPDSGEGQGAPATSGSATWLHTFFDTDFWTTPGGDFAAPASATVAVAGQLNIIVPVTFSGGGMVADVQGWVNAPATNFGWILIGEETEFRSAKRFNSREHPFPDSQPTLTVDFTSAQPGVLQFSTDSLTVDEADGMAMIDVTRSGGSDGEVSATVSTQDGTAAADADYTSVMTTVTFADGESGSKTVAIPILDDAEDEADETLSVNLSNPTGGATLGDNDTLQLTIVDDDLAEVLYFAQFGNGEGFVSQIFLIAPEGSSTVAARLDVRRDDGSPFEGSLNGMPLTNGSLQVDIAPSGVAVLSTDGLGPVEVGSVTVSADGPLNGVILFGGPTGLAGVAGSQGLTGFVAPVEIREEISSNTGIALQNLEDVEVTVQVTLRNGSGTNLGTDDIVIPARGHLSRFVTELNFGDVVQTDFQGTIAVTASGRIAATPLQQRPGQLTTLPVIEDPAP